MPLRLNENCLANGNAAAYAYVVVRHSKNGMYNTRGNGRQKIYENPQTFFLMNFREFSSRFPLGEIKI